AALGEAAARIGLHDVGIDAHELREALRDDAEVTAGDLAAQRYEDHYARTRARRGQLLTARGLEGDHRDRASAPVDRAEIPGRRPRHLLRRLPRDHFGDAGARHDEP